MHGCIAVMAPAALVEILRIAASQGVQSKEQEPPSNVAQWQSEFASHAARQFSEVAVLCSNALSQNIDQKFDVDGESVLFLRRIS